MAGAESTVRVKVCDGVRAHPVGGVDGDRVGAGCSEAAGVPAIVAVPSPLSVKVTPEGRSPVADSAAVGNPVEVTVKLPDVPVTNVAADAEVMSGAASTVRVKVWEASGLTPLVASMVIG